MALSRASRIRKPAGTGERNNALGFNLVLRPTTGAALPRVALYSDSTDAVHLHSRGVLQDNRSTAAVYVEVPRKAGAADPSGTPHRSNYYRNWKAAAVLFLEEQ